MKAIPRGEEIKNSMKNKIQVCECGHPLITFLAVDFREWGCTHCGRTYQFFDDYEMVESTESLWQKKIASEKLKAKLYNIMGNMNKEPLTQDDFQRALLTMAESNI